MNKKRISFILVCTAFVVILFLFSLFIAVESGHACEGAHCPVCACVEKAEQVIRQFGSCMIAAGSVFIVLYKAYRTDFCKIYYFFHATPVFLKVRMNN